MNGVDRDTVRRELERLKLRKATLEAEIAAVKAEIDRWEYWQQLFDATKREVEKDGPATH